MHDTDLAHEIVDALRAGGVPERGLEHLAVGVDAEAEALRDRRVQAGRGRSTFKFVRGEYGSGKTFLTSLAAAEALKEGFAVSRIVVGRDSPLNKLELLYRNICLGLATQSRPKGGALQSIVDRWIFGLEETVAEIQGIEEDSPEFVPAVRAVLEQRLMGVGEQAGRMAACLSGYQQAQLKQDFACSRDLVDWLSGEPKVAAASKKTAGLIGHVGAQDARVFLKGLLVMLNQAGYKGLVLVIDETATLLKTRKPEWDGSLDVLQKLVDALAANEYPGLSVFVTGTPDFFTKAVADNKPLKQRIDVQFSDHEPDNYRQPQIRLRPFSQDRLLEVARKVRSLYPARHPDRLKKATDATLGALVAKVCKRFGGKVDVTPRLFLRELVHVLDLLDQYPDFAPDTASVDARLAEVERNPEEDAAWVEI